MKKVLIIGASILQLPAILKAKELGYCVAAADYNPNAVGVPYADEFFNVSTIDAEGVTEAARLFMPDGVMTLATDMPMRSVAAACKALGLPGISAETAIKATDKAEMIKAFEEHGVEHPWYYVVKKGADPVDIAEHIAFPCISKPTDNAGSRGVMLIRSAEELKSAIEYSSANGRSGEVIIEEYLTGKEVSVEVMAVRGDIHVLQVTDKITTGAPHFVEMGHTQPSRLPYKDVEAIKDLAKRAVKAIGIDDGPAHVEIMLTKDGPKMIELGARMGGDCITTHLVPLSTGIDMVEATLKVSLGEEPDIEMKYKKGSAIRYIHSPIGLIRSIVGTETARAVPGVVEVAFTKAIGERTGELGSSTDRVGYVIAGGEDADDAERICEEALEALRITVE
ncbi:MAG: ATP-grasp domain-containing protein [Clostridiales bacterium]|nr:ATP-grasp domain-containing protein [Clostridiales bacterium]